MYWDLAILDHTQNAHLICEVNLGGLGVATSWCVKYSDGFRNIQNFYDTAVSSDRFSAVTLIDELLKLRMVSK